MSYQTNESPGEMSLDTLHAVALAAVVEMIDDCTLYPCGTEVTCVSTPVNDSYSEALCACDDEYYGETCDTRRTSKSHANLVCFFFLATMGHLNFFSGIHLYIIRTSAQLIFWNKMRHQCIVSCLRICLYMYIIRTPR